MSKPNRNAMWLKWLEEMRDEEEHGSYKFMTYKKAINSLKKETKEYTDPDALHGVKFIGPNIVSRFKKLLKEAGNASTIGDKQARASSPVKRNRNSSIALASTSAQTKKRGRPSKQPLFEETSDEDEPPPAAKRYAGPSRNIDVSSDSPSSDHGGSGPQFAFAPPLHPLGVPPQPYQPQGNPYNVNASQLKFNSQSLAQGYVSPAQGYSQHHHPSCNALTVSHPLGAQSIPIFYFYFVDSDNQRVQSHEASQVDIHEMTLWHKIGFLDSDVPGDHPIRRQLRLLPGSGKGKRREEFIEAWIRDETIEKFSLQIAPGFSPVKHANNFRSGLGSSFHVSHDVRSDPSTQNASVQVTKVSHHNSLDDLLKAEQKKKKITLDPARTTDIGEEWNVQKRNTGHDGHPGMVKAEVYGERKVGFPSHQTNMKERVAWAAMARQQLQSTASQLTSSQEHIPAVPKVMTKPEISGSSLREPSRLLPSKHSLQFNFSLNPPQPAASELNLPRTFSAPVSLAHSNLPATKAKVKGRVRGRVSEFAPPLAIVDEFDRQLDKQAAAQHTETGKCNIGSASNVSADLIDDVTDLTVGSTSFPAFNPIVFPANLYDIVLILDNREVKSQKHRDHIVVELRKKGVNVEQRSLALGDVLWIARRRLLIADEVNDECVLDYILERKRLDDLCLSIKDGRFHEQKFRLSNTALKVFYLIEDYDVERNRETFGVQIDTARSSVQIVDGFILKETKKLSNTIDYLATMHETILEIYQDKPIHILPPYMVKRHSYMALQKHLRQAKPTINHLISYACFEQLNSKSANLTTRDLLAQMLLQQSGASGMLSGRQR
ncbi:hypothetical protein K439DRAFT_1642615 [Ramaria rubella]|nr:hypothetical protein K439DRAFT_1642615 [Ramaria rubella]